MCRGTDGSSYDVMCRHVDVSLNSNKFYLIQLVANGHERYVFTRWGRLGESGAVALRRPFSAAEGEQEFKSIFESKTANSWDDRANFVEKPGKYHLVPVSIPLAEA